VITGKGSDHITGIATQNIQLSADFLQSGAGASELAATLRESAGIYQSAIDTGAGDDEVSGSVQGTGVLDLSRGIVDSFINVGSGNDKVRGSILDSVVHGGSGDDRIDISTGLGSIIDGGSGDDRIAIDGKSEGMQLFGGTGDDIVIGGTGNDDISGGTGSDVLRGGKGADNFLFDASSFGRGTDLVSDFNRSEGDKLQLASALTGIVKGAEAFFVDASMAESTNRSTAFIYDTLENIQGQTRSSIHMAYASDQGALMYDEDGDWSQGSTVLAVVRGTGSGGLKSSDMQFV
jgi:Ca2+-binding RTX toxin-like protein